jgi:MOSC domain-containing protein YiiM
MASELLSIQVGLPRELGIPEAIHPDDRLWTSGFYKSPVAEPRMVRRLNIDGDGQADLVNHGGIDKAICVYSADHYPYWRSELNLPELPFGAFGENFTVGNLTEEQICIGDTWQAGDVLVQVSQPRQPCWKLARRWRIKTLALQVQVTGKTGWYFRVLQEGVIAAPVPLTLLERPFPDWTVARANYLMHHDKGDFSLAGELAAVPLLSASWKATLSRRASAQTNPDPRLRLEGK